MEQHELELFHELHAYAMQATALTIIAEEEHSIRKHNKRKCWIKSWRNRTNKPNTLREDLLTDVHDYRRYLRLDEGAFQDLLQKVDPLIRKMDTTFRKSITSCDRLTITLRYLATGESRASLHFQYRVGRSTANAIIAEVTLAIYTVLKDEYLRTPDTTAEWEIVAKQFFQLWNFPNCLGALDGKHVNIQQPPKSGSHFYNYKNRFSIVLLALVDANLRFLYVDVGTNGRVSDGGVYGKSSLKQALDMNSLNMPISGTLPGSNLQSPFVMLADDAFPLSDRLMKPYPGANLSHNQRIFNYRLSRARRTVENAFGILSSKFRVFRTEIFTTVPRIKHITLACCALHNYLKDHKELGYINPNALHREDITTGSFIHSNSSSEATGFQPLVNRGGRSNIAATVVRDELKEYFVGSGAVYWQDSMLGSH